MAEPYRVEEPERTDPQADSRAIDLKDIVRFVIHWAMQMAARRGWGELRLTVQRGSITVVTETRSHRDGLPAIKEEAATEVTRRLRAVSAGG